MEKILLAIDATEVNMNVLNFACYIANLTDSKLTGVFLEDLIGEPEPKVRMMLGSPYVECITVNDVPGNANKIRLCNSNIELFEEACKNRGVDYTVHRKTGNPLAEIVTESQFADLLIIDAEMCLETKREAMPSRLVKEILTKSECPVVISPFKFTGIDEVVFAYDGSISAVFAIKQFTYLFPELTDKKLSIVQVGESEETPLIEKNRIADLLKTHFSNIEFHALQGRASDELFGYLLEKENIFVVMGAFGRSAIPAFFKKSTAELIIKTTNLPFFIAHP